MIDIIVKDRAAVDATVVNMVEAAWCKGNGWF
jgi:hypothetical protein